MSRALADALEKLLAASGRAAASLFTPTQRRELDLFARQTNALRLITQGSGASYQLLDAALARMHLQTLRPVAEIALDAGLPQRANNVAHMRDSKGRGHAHGTAYLLLKAIGPGATWQRGDGAHLDVSAGTAIAGAMTIAIAPDDDWFTPGPIWLVENQALFDRLDWLPAEAEGTVLYYGGQMSNLLLAWIAKRSRASRLEFFPDYDGVGLHNYARLLQHVQVDLPLSFWLMPNWRERLAQFGNNDLWQRTYKDFTAAIDKLRASGAAPEVMALCQAMADHGLALEHEAVWLVVR